MLEVKILSNVEDETSEEIYSRAFINGEFKKCIRQVFMLKSDNKCKALILIINEDIAYYYTDDDYYKHHIIDYYVPEFEEIRNICGKSVFGKGTYKINNNLTLRILEVHKKIGDILSLQDITDLTYTFTRKVIKGAHH